MRVDFFYCSKELKLVEHWKISKLNAQLFDFNSECARKAMNERLFIGGLMMNGEIKRFFCDINCRYFL